MCVACAWRVLSSRATPARRLGTQHIVRSQGLTRASLPHAAVTCSANGTFVNKQRLRRGRARQLRNGDTVSLVVPSQNRRESAFVTALVVPYAASLPGRNPLTHVGTCLAILASTAFAAFIFQQNSTADVEADDKRRIERTSGRDILQFYDIREELGAGTYATVRRAVHKETGEEVAVKIIDKKRCAAVPCTAGDWAVQRAGVGVCSCSARWVPRACASRQVPPAPVLRLERPAARGRGVAEAEPPQHHRSA